MAQTRRFWIQVRTATVKGTPGRQCRPDGAPAEISKVLGRRRAVGRK